MFDILYTIIIHPIILIIEFIFYFSYILFKDAGISLITISIAISILCLPIYAIAEKWQQRERNIVNKLKPKVNKIKKAFKGDEQYMILSTYYKQNHYHPLYSLRGSLVFLFQIPFFIAAYSYLSHLELLKGLSFLFIKDLGSPDSLLSIKGISINLLPILMTLVNIISGVIYAKDLQSKDKLQLYGIAFIFLLLLYNSPSALVLYWTMNNVFSLFKNIYYKLNIKNNLFILSCFISFLCVLIIFFLLIRFSHVDIIRQLIIILFLISLIPWIYIFFKKSITKIMKIDYNKVLSLSIFIFSSAFLFILFGLFIPSNLIHSSPQEFSFIDNYTAPIFFIINTALQSFGLFFIWPLCLYFLFSNTVKNYFSIMFSAVCICSFVNLFLFAGNYGMLSINFIFDTDPNHSNKTILLNIFLLILIFILFIILFKTKIKKILPVIISICGISLLFVSAINIFGINKEFNHLNTYYKKQDDVLDHINPIFKISQNGKNVIIIMIDRAISGFLPHIMEESPELKQIYSGFKYYPNTVSFGGYTHIGAPPVFGGYEYSPEEMNNRVNTPLVDKHNESLLMLPVLLSENDFFVTVTDPPYANYNIKSDLSIFNQYPEIISYLTESKYTEYWLNDNNFKLSLSSDIIKRNLLLYSIFKGSPLVLRKPLYMNGTWCSPASDQRLRLFLDSYSVLDYLIKLTEINDNDINTALILTNNTTHVNSFLQAPDYVPSLVVTNFGTSSFSKEYAYHINTAAIKRIGSWLIFLKENNVYDNTRIIIVSDHGPEYNFFEKTDTPFNIYQFNPLLLVKDFDAAGTIHTDMSFMSNADVPYILISDIIDKPMNPFTGNDITIDFKNKPLYIAISGRNHLLRNNYQFELNPNTDHFVHKNIFTKENWVKASDFKHAF